LVIGFIVLSLSFGHLRQGVPGADQICHLNAI
jgi:hypothetical protein